MQQKISAAPSISTLPFNFGAHDEVVHGKAGGLLLRWRLPLFAFLFRNSVRAVDLFNLPPSNFLEICRQIEI
jgi:KUP system potassium uptake protein